MNFLPRRWHHSLLILLCVVLCSGCAKHPFERHPPQVMPELSSAQLLENWWLASGHRYLCRHSGLLEVFTRKVALEGVVKLDTSASTARLIAMDTMGVKLFDLSVDATDHHLNYVLPLLEEHPQLPELVAKSIRAIFLQPNPSPHDRLLHQERGAQLISSEGQRFELIGMPVRLHRKQIHSAEGNWQVEYNQYQQQGGIWAPTGVVLNDGRGFRLTLWIQEIRELQ